MAASMMKSMAQQQRVAVGSSQRVQQRSSSVVCKAQGACGRACVRVGLRACVRPCVCWSSSHHHQQQQGQVQGRQLLAATVVAETWLAGSSLPALPHRPRHACTRRP